MKELKELAQIEQHFQSFVLDGAQDIAPRIVGTESASASVRLDIYADAYRSRLQEALRSNYPVLARLLGARQFNELATTYIDQHPPTHFSIRWYGDRLADLLARANPYCEQPLLTELARWEWAMTLAFDAADAPVLKKELLATLTPSEWDELRFKPHPSLQLLSLGANAPQVWQALNKDEPPPLPDAGEKREHDGKRAWIIWRRDLQTYFRLLEGPESRALQSALAGETFAQICASLSIELGEQEAASAASGLLVQWLAAGLFAV